MKYNPGHIDLSGLPRAIDFDAQVARNREIIQALHTQEEYDEVKFVAEITGATLEGNEAFEELVEICENFFSDTI